MAAVQATGKQRATGGSAESEGPLGLDPLYPYGVRVSGRASGGGHLLVRLQTPGTGRPATPMVGVRGYGESRECAGPATPGGGCVSERTAPGRGSGTVVGEGEGARPLRSAVLGYLKASAARGGGGTGGVLVERTNDVNTVRWECWMSSSRIIRVRSLSQILWHTRGTVSSAVFGPLRPNGPPRRTTWPGSLPQAAHSR